MTVFSNKLPVSEPSPKYHSKLNWNLNTQLTEYRTEEHHREWVGINKFRAFILYFLNREPGHTTTLKSPS